MVYNMRQKVLLLEYKLLVYIHATLEKSNLDLDRKPPAILNFSLIVLYKGTDEKIEWNKKPKEVKNYHLKYFEFM